MSDGAVVEEAANAAPAEPRPPRPKRREVNGWLVLDKPVGMTSTHAVAVAKRVYNAKKAGHAGTLDPLASGLLPIAFGEATKTVPFVMDGRKRYRFTVTWGTETDTDDAEGSPVATSPERPGEAAILAALPMLRGEIMQTPPAFSAIKVEGNRAYDLSRAGEQVELKPRAILIHALDLAEHGGDTSVFEAETGKGAYVRALARDLGRMLGCHGHVSALRRTRVGPFEEAQAAGVEALREAAAAPEGAATLAAALNPVLTALADIPQVAVERPAAGRLRQGRGVLLRGADAPLEGIVAVTCGGSLVALARVEGGEARPERVFSGG